MIKKSFYFRLYVIIFFFLVLRLSTFSQTFPPAPGVMGSTAISKDSSVIIAWAKSVEVERGFMNVLNPAAGRASFGEETNALGKAQGDPTNVISLGDSGVAIITFDQPIRDEEGPDFAVFENGFSDGFIELAFVEVSSDGINYVRFPSTSEAPVDHQIGAFDMSDCRYFENLAGKYRVGFGTPFDLHELSGKDGLDISHITHVKLIDVIGSIDTTVGSFDRHGTIINDLFPTEFPSGGFDLDGVGVMHQAPLSVDETTFLYSVFPNPTAGFLTINAPNKSIVRILTISGLVVYEDEMNTQLLLDVSQFNEGLVIIEIGSSGFVARERVVIL